LSEKNSRTQQKRSLRTRENLIDAALALFARRGFQGATTREIAKEAGVALAALPYHFQTKQALWQAAAEKIFAEFATQLARKRGSIQHLGDREQTRLMLREYLLFVSERPEMLQLIFSEGTESGPRMEWLVSRMIRPNFEYIKKEVSRAVKNGYGRKGLPEHLYYMMVGAAALPYVLAPEFRTLTGYDPLDPEIFEAHSEALLDLFYPEQSERSSED
jgi:AcrR family transcriptional regulator